MLVSGPGIEVMPTRNFFFIPHWLKSSWAVGAGHHAKNK